MQIRNSLVLAGAVFLFQQTTPPTPLIRANATVKISEHVYVIPDANVGGVPNVGIVVGNKATLVVDTGLGPRNGETVLREVGKVSRNPDIYIVATHFHSEHTLGESAFPANAKVIRARALQQEIDEIGVQPNFATRSPAMAELMKDATFRKADEIFDQEKTLDLGGVHVRLLWFGGTHTNGDTLIFIEGDNVLFAGDVIMNRRFLAFSARSSVQDWLRSLDEAAPGASEDELDSKRGDAQAGRLRMGVLGYPPSFGTVLQHFGPFTDGWRLGDRLKWRYNGNFFRVGA